MSGSGASCFALFSNRVTAEAARAQLAAARPQWWCAAGSLITGDGSRSRSRDSQFFSDKE
jgi:4-diphosphocytidyl-2-C-methyl-D-erythritol kinase